MPFVEAPAYKANLKRNVLGNINTIQSSVIKSTSIIEEKDIDNVDIELEAGENVAADNAGTIINGKIYKATNLYSDAKPPMGIILESIEAGSTAKLRISGIISITPSVPFIAGKNVFVRPLEPNVCYVPPVVKSSNEDLIQSLGTALSTSDIFINIGTGHRLEC